MAAEKKQIPDVYQIVTDRIIALLEKGRVPWKKPWTEAGIPMNLISGKPYRGINIWMLASLDYDRNCFLSFNQAVSLQGKVKKGERACPVVFWKKTEKEDKATGEKKASFLLRYYSVFNIDQCEGIPLDLIPENLLELRENEPIEECNSIIACMPNAPNIRHKGSEAFYLPTDDFITMPKMASFESSETYYNVLFHELVHSTGHVNRLNRKEIAERIEITRQSHSLEELVAEMGAAYLNSVAGITTEKLIENNAGYIQGWLKVLKNDKRFIVQAGSSAQKAVDYILHTNPAEPEPVQAEEV